MRGPGVEPGSQRFCFNIPRVNARAITGKVVSGKPGFRSITLERTNENFSLLSFISNLVQYHYAMVACLFFAIVFFCSSKD